MGSLSQVTGEIASPTVADLPPAVSAESVVRRILDISTLPHVALKVMEVARDPDAGVGDLRNVVEGDPSLSTRVLRMVNSAAYGLQKRVSNLHQAIGYLGFSQVRNLALTASVSEIFKKTQQLGSYSRDALWKHLVAVGICARMVARRQQLEGFEDAFLGGLLHDIGIVLIDQHANSRFKAMINSLNKRHTLVENEREALGFDHCVLGDLIAEQWRFPPVVRAAIRYHHMAARYDGEDVALVACVEVGNVLCTMKGITSVGVKLVKPSLETFQILGLQRDDIVVLAADLDAELQTYESLFETG